MKLEYLGAVGDFKKCRKLPTGKKSTLYLTFAVPAPSRAGSGVMPLGQIVSVAGLDLRSTPPGLLSSCDEISTARRVTEMFQYNTLGLRSTLDVLIYRLFRHANW